MANSALKVCCCAPYLYASQHIYKCTYMGCVNVLKFLVFCFHPPIKTFFTINGLLPNGESKPPSMEKPNPQLSLTISTDREPVAASSVEGNNYFICLTQFRLLDRFYDSTNLAHEFPPQWRYASRRHAPATHWCSICLHLHATADDVYVC